VREGEDGELFYAIAEGSVDVVAGGRLVARLGRGEGFGEIALLHDVPRTATVTAVTNVSLFALARDDFLLALTRHPAARELARDVAADRLDELAKLDAPG
jgi:CRP-like cAMP-binding protein